nr:hypothetical protein [Tanacetum cinerariifolium]
MPAGISGHCTWECWVEGVVLFRWGEGVRGSLWGRWNFGGKNGYGFVRLGVDSEIVVLKNKLEKISKEKDDLDNKIEKFENASQSLDKLIGSQITDKKFTKPDVESYGVNTIEVVTQTSSVKISKHVKENNGAVLIEDWESEGEDEVESPPEIKRKTVEPSMDKARCKYHQREKMVIGTNHSRVNHTANTVPKAVLIRTGLKPVNTVRHVNPKSTRKSFQRRTTYNNRNFSQKVNTAKGKVNTATPNSTVLNAVRENKGKAIKASACWKIYPISLTLRSLIEGMLHLGRAKGGKITRKGIIRTDKLDFEDVYFVKELQFNLFSFSCMCDKKNSVLFTDTECFVLSPDFKLADESHVLLKVLRKNNMYIVDIKNIVPTKDLTCLVVKAINDESMLWHKRLGHINYKIINKLVKENLVRATKNETSRILKTFITEIENPVDKKVKIIRCDNGTEFKNSVMNKFCEEKDSKLRTTFWAEAVNIACYVQNRVLVVKPHLKTPYELFRGRTHALSFMRPFGFHVTILNTLDQLGKFDRKSDEGFFVGYSTNSKAFRVYNTRTRKVEENLHINFLENKPIIVGTMSNDFAGKRASFNAIQSSIETGPSQDYILMPLWNDGSLFDSYSKDSYGDNKDNDGPCKESEVDNQERANAENSTKDVNTAGSSINTASSNINTASPTVNTVRQSDDFFGTDNDMRIWCTKRRMTVTTNEQGFISAIYEEKTHEDLYTCLFACFLSQEEPKRITNALKDPAWVEAMQEKLLQFHLQKVWILVDLPQGIDYDEVFASVARIEAIRLFLAYASFIGFLVYHIDVKSAFLYGRIEEEVHVCQPLGFYPDKVYKLEKALYSLHQAPRAWYETLAKYLLENGFYRGKIDQILFIKRQKRIFCLYKYVKPASTPMDKEKALLKDSDGDDVDVHLYSARSKLWLPLYEAEYVAAASCCGQVLWIQNQLLDYGRSTTNIVEFDIRQEDDKHNMVAFLKKPQGSEDFHQIVDFLNASHI